MHTLQLVPAGALTSFVVQVVAWAESKGLSVVIVVHNPDTNYTSYQGYGAKGAGMEIAMRDYFSSAVVQKQFATASSEGVCTKYTSHDLKNLGSDYVLGQLCDDIVGLARSQLARICSRREAIQGRCEVH